MILLAFLKIARNIKILIILYLIKLLIIFIDFMMVQCGTIDGTFLLLIIINRFNMNLIVAVHNGIGSKLNVVIDEICGLFGTRIGYITCIMWHVIID